MKKDQNRSHNVTEEGFQGLKEQLQYLTEVKKPELLAAIEEARSKGDLRENEGYTIALESYESNQLNIAEIEKMIETAVIVESSPDDTVSVGSKVKVKLKEKHVEYHIVGHSEANSLENKISDQTPIGMALLGKKVGETVKVDLPVGSVEYEIIEIS